MGILQDLRFAARVLWKKPAFTLVIVLTLALGIGAGSSMFSVVHTLLLRPLDLPELDRLAVVNETASIPGYWNDELAPRAFFDVKDQARSFSDLCAYQWWSVALTGDGADPEEVTAFQVSPGWFNMLGVRPALGRWFAPDEIDGKNPRVVMLSHKLWDRRYAADRAIVGKTLTLGGDSYTVVGVMPKGFALPASAELYAPLTLTGEQRADRGSRYLGIVGRLAPGVDLDGAHAEIAQVGERIAAEFPLTNAGRRMRLISLADGITEDMTRDVIYMLFGAGLFVLLISCANVANVFLAHAMSRRRELAVRAALGAGRGRIVRQLVTEAALLGGMGGVASLLVAAWSLELLKGSIPSTMTQFIANWDNMGVNPVVMGFALSVGVAVGILFGVLPAMQVSRIDVNAMIKDGDRGSSGGHGQRLRSVLVVAQVALALVMLIGAGSMVKAFQDMVDRPERYAPENLLTLRLNPPESRYPEPRHVEELARRSVERLAALPGLEAVGATSNIPWGQNGWTRGVSIEGFTPEPGRTPVVDFRIVTPGYLATLKAPVLEGRGLADSDGAEAQKVALVTTASVRKFWSGTSPVGKRIRLGTTEQSPWVTVVGVVPDLEQNTAESAPRPAVFVPMAQSTPRGFYLVMRASDPLGRAHEALAAVHELDPLLPATMVRTLIEARAERMSGTRAASAIMGSFAFVALLLAVVGIYGVIANLVTQRTREIGVRMALGASRADVLRLVLRRGVVLTGIGVILGLVMGGALVKFLSSVLTGLFGGGTGLLLLFGGAVAGAALLGCWIPARRATRVDPMIALRAE